MKELTLTSIIPQEWLDDLYKVMVDMIDCPLSISNSSSCDDVFLKRGLALPSLCEKARNLNRDFPICSMSDSYASMEASYLRKPYLYVCPMGAIDYVSPIIYDKTIVGSINMGRIRTDPDKMETLPHIPLSPLCSNIDPKRFNDVIENCSDTPQYIPWDTLQQYTAMLDIFTRMIETKVESCMAKIELKDVTDQLKELDRSLSIANGLTDEYRNFEAEHVDCTVFFTQAMPLINDIALMEDATQTSEALVKLSAVLTECRDMHLCEPARTVTGNIEEIFDAYSMVHDNLSLECCSDLSDGTAIPGNIIMLILREYLDSRIVPMKKQTFLNIRLTTLDNSTVSIVIEDNGEKLPSTIHTQLTVDPLPREPIIFALYAAKRALGNIYGSHAELLIETSGIDKTITTIEINMENNNE